MPQNNDVTTSFNVDISQLKKAMQDAQRQIRLANAEFNSASTAMDEWATSADGIGEKLKQLNTTVNAQETILNCLEQQYTKVCEEQGETSRGAEELRIKIENQRAAINRTNAEIANWNTALQNLDNNENQTLTATQRLSQEIAEQETQLQELKQRYSDLALEQGESSDEARELASRIGDLSTELNENRTRLADAEQAANDLDNSLEDVGESAEESSDGFTILKGAFADLLANGIQACVAGLKDLTTELLTDSSNAYAQFAAATGTAVDAMGEYEDAIKNVYKNNFGESLEDVAQKMTKVKEVTGELDASKLQEMTEKAMTLEDTFDMDMTETLRGVNALMTHFGMTSTEAFDLLSAGAQNGLNYTDELGDNISEYASKFAEAGYSSEEYFQLLKNGAEGGAYNLDKVNDAVNEVTTRLADGTIADGLESFSAKTQETFKSWQDGGATQKAVIDQIVKDIQNTKGEQEKMNLAALAFGTMAEDGGTKYIQQLTSIGSSFSDVKGKADELAAVKYTTPKAALESIGRTIKTDVLEPLANKLTPTLNDIIAWLDKNKGGIINTLSSVGDAVMGLINFVLDNKEGIIAALSGIAAGLIAWNVASMINGVVSAVKAFQLANEGATVAQALLNGVMNANPIMLIITAVATLVTALITFIATNEDVRKKIVEVWGKITDAFGKAVEWIGEKMREVGKFFTETLPEAFKKAAESAKQFVASTVDKIKELPEKIWEKLLLAIAKVTEFFTNIITKAKEKASTFITSIINKIKDLPGSMWEKFTETITKVGTFFSDIITTATTKGAEFVTSLVNKIKEMPGKIWEKLLLVIAKVTEFGSSVKEKAVEAGQKLVAGIINKIKSLPDDVKDIGINIVTGLWNGITNKFEWLTNKIKSFAKNVVDKLKNFFGIHSPSRVMRDEVGKYLALGIAEGITKNKDSVTKAMQALKDDVVADTSLYDVEGAKARIYSSIMSGGVGSTSSTSNNTYTFNQYNTSPKALSRLEIYRQTRNQLNFAKGV